MTGPVRFIDYHGQIDFQVIDSLLMELKKNLEFQELFMTVRKRTYSLIVESIENVCKYSALKSSSDIDLQPKIIVSSEEEHISIVTGNPVREDKKDNLVQKLEYVNSLNTDTLKKLHEARINTKPAAGENGAGLGFICMAFKTGKRLIYRFKPLKEGYLYFELELCLNK